MTNHANSSPYGIYHGYSGCVHFDKYTITANTRALVHLHVQFHGGNALVIPHSFSYGVYCKRHNTSLSCACETSF